MRTPALVAASLAFACSCQHAPIHLQPTDERLQTLSYRLQMSDPEASIQLLKGFHEIEQNSWRWTAGAFSVTLRPPAGSEKRGVRVIADFSFPEAVFARTGPASLTATIRGSVIGSQEYGRPGNYTFAAAVPPTALDPEGITIDFRMSKYLAAGTADYRELALIMRLIELQLR